jgi:hypothetical protein
MVARQHSRHGLPRRAVSIAIMGLLGLLLGATSVFAQERSVRWARWDVRIDNVDTAGNQFRVAETQVIEFTGTYSFGSRTLPLRRLTDIQNITVTQAGQPLSAGCDDRPGAYCVSRTGDGYSVKYYFTRPVSDSQVQIELAYTVLGALRIRPESDELFWSVISAGKPGPVASGRVVVVMPDRFAPQPDTVLVTGVGANVATQGGNITATMLGSLPAQTAFEIQFRYPHNSDAVPPPWQKAEEDAQTAIERNLEQGRQIAAAASRMNGLILVGAVLIGLLTAFPMLLVLRRSRPLPKAVPSADDPPRWATLLMAA